MPFCPQCHYEYTDDVKECPDCHKKLVAQLPTPDVDPDIQWIALHSLPGIVYAEMAKVAIENAGIPCYLKQDVITGALGSKGAGAVGAEVILFVPEEHKEKAEKILHEMLDHI